MPYSKQPKTKQHAMGKGHKYQRSSSGAPFGSSNRKRSFGPRNASASFHQPQDNGFFNARRDSRFGFNLQGPPPPHHLHHPHPPPPPPFHGWHARNGRPSVHSGSPPLRPFDTTPPAMPYDFPPPQHFYPPMPYPTERGFGGPFRRSAEHEHQEFQDRLFLEDYRFAGPHQTFQPPAVDMHLQTPPELAWRGENPYELVEQPLAQSIQLRGDAPEFVPHWKASMNEEPAPKSKEPCWFVVSST